MPPTAEAHEVPAIELAEPNGALDVAVSGSAEPTDETGAQDDSPRRSRKRLVIISVAAATTLGLLLGGVGLVQHQKEQARLVAIAQSEHVRVALCDCLRLPIELPVDSLNYSINQLTSVPLQLPAKPEV